jgi:hypothetical protein
VIAKPTVGFTVAQAAPVQVSKSLTVGPLTIGKADAAAAPAPAPAAPAPAPEAKKPEASTPTPEKKPAAEAKPAPAAEAKPAPAAEKKEEPKAPAAAPPTPAKTSAPVVLPRGAPVAGTSDINQALQCQSAFNAFGGRTGVESALGDVCKEGSASFSALGCCQAVRGEAGTGRRMASSCTVQRDVRDAEGAGHTALWLDSQKASPSGRAYAQRRVCRPAAAVCCAKIASHLYGMCPCSCCCVGLRWCLECPLAHTVCPALLSCLLLCPQTAKLLNSGNLNKCACNNLVYQQLCQEVRH